MPRSPNLVWHQPGIKLQQLLKNRLPRSWTRKGVPVQIRVAAFYFKFNVHCVEILTIGEAPPPKLLLAVVVLFCT